jgi:hypothetical protein
MGEGFVTVTLRELVSFAIAVVGLSMFAYPQDYVFLVNYFGGKSNPVAWLGLALIVLAIYVYQNHLKYLRFLERAIG